MVFQDILLDSTKLAELREEGVMQSLVEHSKVYFDNGTYAYPGVDYTKEEIAKASIETITEYWYNLALSYASDTKPENAPGRRLYCMLIDGYPVDLSLCEVEGTTMHRCNNLYRPDAQGTKNYIFKYEFQNARGASNLAEGVTLERTYVDIGGPMKQSVEAVAAYFSSIEECNIRDWSTCRYVGQETQHYSTGGQTWPGVKSEYSATFDVFEIEVKS